MYTDEVLNNHLETSYTVKSSSAVIAEWNMNVPGNIQQLGNYRYRKFSTQYNSLPNFFDRVDNGNYYTGATDSSISVSAGFDADGETPLLFQYTKEKESLYYSLEDCIKPFRPRSGINKASFFNGKYIHNQNTSMYKRPRYYMPHKDDEYKYWRSYRTESNGDTVSSSNLEYGISKNNDGGLHFIDDACPFVVYKEIVPANRIVIKVQTNVGDVDLGPFRTSGMSSMNDPYYGDYNKTVPQNFKVQYLTDNDQWVDAYIFTSSSYRDSNETPIFGADGTLSLEYGLEIPTAYKDTFFYVGTTTSENNLPSTSVIGYAYLVQTTPKSRGTMYVYNGTSYDQFTPTYNWLIGNDEVYDTTNFVTDLTDPPSYNDTNDATALYREFVWMKGIRLVVETMTRPNVPLELIEFSPRLVADLSQFLIEYSVTKMLSDLTSTSLPVGQLQASTGVVQLFDEDNSFNINNTWDAESETGSIIAKYIQKNIKLTFYEVIRDVGGQNYYVPIKSLYSEGIPQVDQINGLITINLRDFYFYLESIKAPQLLLTEVSLSQAICILLDSIGFSNYVFKRLDNETDPVIPFFFIAPEQNVAEVLNQLALATQSAMYFDEYNNFIVMSKNYLLDDSGSRDVNMVLYGTQNQYDSGVIENPTNGPITNIIEIASKDQKVFNAGTINYTARYIQRSYGSIKQASLVDSEKTWIYKPVLLWEVSGTEATKSLNNAKQQKYVLGAMPLNSDLIDSLPTVVNRELVNNTLDLGENVYYITRFQGYFYANGEIIKYDAVQYTVTGVGNVWISNNLEYQQYFSKLPFNGKIYPTGLVRIYTKSYYETIGGVTKMKNGAVAEHGRAQFNTPIAYHNSGLNSYWSDNSYIQGCQMKSEYLFSTSPNLTDEITIVFSSGTTMVTKDVSKLHIGQQILITSGPGELSSLGPTIITDIYDIKTPEAVNYAFVVNYAPTVPLQNTQIIHPIVPPTVPEATGLNQALAKKSLRNGIVKNFLSSGFSNETDVAFLKTAETGTVQSSALIFSGPDFDANTRPQDFISYVWKSFTGAYKHVGTRMRIIGKVEASSDRLQSPFGSMTYYNVTGADSTQAFSIGGGSGGISIVNPNTNNGYYLELAALTAGNIESYLDIDVNGVPSKAIDNILFYKIEKDANSNDAIPVKLWGGNGNILVDDGSLIGQYRFIGDENPTVYDIAIEYIDVNETTRSFYIYINQKLVKIVDDITPMPLINPSIGLFVRGTSKLMFENVYALGKNYSSNSVFDLNIPIGSVFNDGISNTINVSEALNKYAVSGAIQKTYLTGINPSNARDYNLYFEEFGTIMRECAYFNIKYDRAYPALYAKIAPTFNRLRGYTVSGFMATSYGAEFLVFNNTDTLLNLDETTGNYLRILGIAFTQDTTNTLTVDDYFKKRGTLQNKSLFGSGYIESPYKVLEDFDIVKTSRVLYGKSEFSLESPYIQDYDTAEDILGWIINKNLRPRKSIGVTIFPNPTLQLGDIVTVSYKLDDGRDAVVADDVRLVVYNMEYSRTSEGPNMIIYLSEV